MGGGSTYSGKGWSVPTLFWENRLKQWRNKVHYLFIPHAVVNSRLINDRNVTSKAIKTMGRNFFTEPLKHNAYGFVCIGFIYIKM